MILDFDALQSEAQADNQGVKDPENKLAMCLLPQETTNLLTQRMTSNYINSLETNDSVDKTFATNKKNFISRICQAKNYHHIFENSVNFHTNRFDE